MIRGQSATPGRVPSVVLALLSLLAAGLAMIPGTASAQTGWSGEIAVRAVESERDLPEGEEIDSSGIGIRGEIGFDLEASRRTRIRFEAEAGGFDYRDSTRKSRETYGGVVSVSHDLTDALEFRLQARRIENIAVLEANQADQTSVGARLQWESGNDRVRVSADYRKREYDLGAPASGDGYRVAAQYRRRIGAYHWLSIDLSHEEMSSIESPRRSYERRVINATYSLPVAKRLRLLPSIDVRKWGYDARIAQGDPAGDFRVDRYAAPGLGLVYGRADSGPFFRAEAEYRLRQSNDQLFGNDGLWIGVSAGYRF